MQVYGIVNYCGCTESVKMKASSSLGFHCRINGVVNDLIPTIKRRNAREGPFDIIGTASSSAKSDEPGRNEKRSKQMESKGTSASTSAHAKGDESKWAEKIELLLFLVRSCMVQSKPSGSRRGLVLGQLYQQR